MSYRTGWSDRVIGEDVDLFTFRFLWVAGPLLVASFLPTLIFGVFVDQWGSNLLWGGVYGLGWCLAAFATGRLGGLATWVGLIWAWTIPVFLYFASGWLWRRLSPGKRRKVVLGLLLSFALIVPAKFFMSSEAAGVHLPDFGWHMANVY
jgi:hypothetical protein